MIEFSPITAEEADAFSEYLHPIWHEVYDDIELGGPEGVEYIFRNWVSGESIRRSMAEGYEFGHLLLDGVCAGVYSFLVGRDGVLHISKLYLEERFRGRGIGQQSIRAMEDVARSRGCDGMDLSVFYYNRRAIRAYERAGFELHHRCLRYIGEGIVQNDYVMTKRL